MVESMSAVGLYLCCTPSCLVLTFSPLVSKDPVVESSVSEGMHMRAMGSLGSFLSMRDR